MRMELACKVPIGMVEALFEAGLSHRDVLATARLPLGLLDRPGPRLCVSDYFAFWQAIAAVSGNPGIGIVLGRSFKSDLTEPLFLAILSAVDVGAAIHVVARYKQTLEPQDLHVTADGAGRITLTCEWPQAETVPQVLVDAEFSFLVEMCRRGTRQPEFSPVELQLQAKKLDAAAAHAAVFRCPIRLGAVANAIVFTSDDMTRPFVTHNPQLHGALIPFLNTHTPPATSALARVRAVLSDRVRGQRPTVRAVGKELAMSGRALQRLLKDHGTSFRQLLDDVRNEHARGYLSTTAFSDGEVAFLLGFEEANSFYRAFRSWNGVSPREYRRRTVTAR